MCHDNEEWCTISRGIDLSFQKWRGKFDKYWPKHSKVSNICTLMGSFWSKYIMFDLRKYRGVIFHDTEEWWKIWIKTDLWFGKWHEKFGKYSPDRALKILKIGSMMGPFYTNWKIYEFMSLKFTEELYDMKMKNDEKRVVLSKLTWEIWRILTWALKSLRNLDFNGLPLKQPDQPDAVWKLYFTLEIN